MFAMITWGLCAIIIFMLAGVMAKIDEIRRLLLKAARATASSQDVQQPATPVETKPTETNA